MLVDATQAEQDRQREAQDQLNERIRQTLGHERYMEYQRAQDYGYQQLHRIAQRAGLQPEVANEVYALRDIALVQAGRVRNDKTLTPEQRTAALQAIRQETERTMQQTLGNDAWQQFNRPSNRHWLSTIAPEARPESVEPSVVP
ncbi:MAG TPA: hypothetical protein VLD18_05665, partial [Verrucomicrobiae bacterium]|nr:hypothetical protein [Verrucomicrobiae bacterium]